MDATTRRRCGWLVALAVGLGWMVPSPVLAKEKVTLPAMVTEAINAAFPGARVTEAEWERDRGVMTYEVEFMLAGQEFEVVVNEAGLIGKVSRELALADVPAVVRTTCEERFPGGKIREVEQQEIRAVCLFGTYALLKEPVVIHEVEIRKADGRKAEVVVDAKGKIQRQQTDDDDGDEDDEDDGDE